MSDPPVIALRELTVRYPQSERPAIASLTLEIGAGQLVGVTGLTGSGKTTLLRCLNGVVPHLVPAAVEGSVVVAGLEVRSTPVREMARRVGMVLDDPEAQLSQPTVAEEVALGLETLAVPWPEMEHRVANTLVSVGLTGVGDRAPLTLSGGEQQRLAVACALAMRPAILALDEPMASLDPAGTSAMIDLIRRLTTEAGMTVVLAELDVELLAEHADRVLVLDEGRLVADGPPGAVFGRPDSLADHGLRPPQVTQAAAWLARRAAGATGSRSSSRPDSAALPVTMDAALAWFAGR